MKGTDLTHNGRMFIACPIEPPPFYGTLLPVTSGAWQVHPDDLHMTLAFLGPCDPERAMAAFDALILDPYAAFEITLKHPLFLGSPPPGSALTVCPEVGAEHCRRMIVEMRPPLLKQAGLSADTRPAIPHVTILRMHRTATPSARTQMEREFVQSLAQLNWRVRIESIALYAGRRDQRASRYLRVSEKRLRGSTR